MTLSQFWPFGGKNNSNTPAESKVIIAQCGHECTEFEQVTLFGETTIERLPIDGNGDTPYCHKCLANMAIQCAWCGKPIYTGTYITLYSPSVQRMSVIHPKAKVFRHEPLTYVGCSRSNCAHTAEDYCGQWIAPGRVLKYPQQIVA